MFPFSARRANIRKSTKQLATPSSAIESLEDRVLLTTFVVLNVNDSGAGSLRQSILDANTTAGADTINFNVAGTIALTSALPVVTGQVDINGASAPGFAGTPNVVLDFNNHAGLRFNAGSDGSTLQSLAVIDSSGSGVTLSGAGNTLIVGNYIGLAADGTTPAPNRGSGLELIHSSGNTIGGSSAADRNVISANGQDGIRLSASSSNVILGNYIGTDQTGTLDRGNLTNGIELTAGSAGNLIGGEATGGNDPTNQVFVRPPDGNLISGNNADGVLITKRATQNQLSGNFIGTDISGNSALGNTLDGVAIVQANANSLIGCTIQDDPFVFYNVVSGNGANGLRVSNSNDTTIQANFFGMGADNGTAVGNGLNGVVVEGTSARTTMGGPIPLGNVDAANGQNGIVVRNTANHFTSYNTFCGLAAFSTDPSFGNGADGMLITSTGGNILIRTNVITENGHDGIEIGGSARDIRVTGNIIGLDTNGLQAMGNVGNGVEVGGNAHDLVIGGPQPTFNIIPQNAISANGDNGVAIVGHAHNITVNNGFMGTNIFGHLALGNDNAGVYVGAGTYSNTIGSSDPTLLTVISGNAGNGVEMQSTHGNTVLGTLIGTSADGLLDLGNGGNGVFINNSSGNTIGSRASGSAQSQDGSGNVIAFNQLDGVFIQSGSGNGIRENSIYSNGPLGIFLSAGANLNQAAPVLTSVQTTVSNILIGGILNSRPCATYVIEFFANDAGTQSGRVFLGSKQVHTNAAGVATFTFQGPLPPSGADFITATATDSHSNTSEFSAPVS